jgi:hypothetical protein
VSCIDEDGVEGGAPTTVPSLSERSMRMGTIHRRVRAGLALVALTSMALAPAAWAQEASGEAVASDDASPQVILDWT